MDIRAEDISKIIREQIGNYAVDVDVAEVGTVIAIGDGIARLHGIERAMAGEMIEFPHSVFGIALNLEEDRVVDVLRASLLRCQEDRLDHLVNDGFDLGLEPALSLSALLVESTEQRSYVRLLLQKLSAPSVDGGLVRRSQLLTYRADHSEVLDELRL